MYDAMCNYLSDEISRRHTQASPWHRRLMAKDGARTDKEPKWVTSAVTR